MITHILTALFALFVVSCIGVLLWHSLTGYGRPS